MTVKQTVSSLCRIAFIGCLVLGGIGLAHSDDWPFFRGPNLNGYTEEGDWEAQFSIDGPPVLWRAEVGIGASGVVVAGTYCVTMGAHRDSDQDAVICLNTDSGKTLWSYNYACRFERRMFDGGTASTPTIAGGLVYSLSHDGQVHCLELETGRLRWRTHLVDDFGGRYSKWKYSGSPLVVDDIVFFDTGSPQQSTVALDRFSGELKWGRGSDKAGYATPIPFEWHGTQGVLVFKAKALVAHELHSGIELWRLPWKSSYNVNASTPIVLNEQLFVSSGYGSGRGALVSLSGEEPEVLWKNIRLKTKTSSAVVIDNAVYGVSESGGKLVCLDLKDGSLQWSQRGFGGGTLIGAGDKLIVLGSKGNLAVVAATESRYTVLSEAQILTGTCWVAPSLAHGRLYCKNNRGKLVCLNLAQNAEGGAGQNN